MRGTLPSLALTLLSLAQVAVAQPLERNLLAHEQLAREIYEELIEINTTRSVGNTTTAAEAMAARLRAAGLPEEDLFLDGSAPNRGNLVARMRGTGRRPPILLLAHLDVVEADPGDWTVDPFTFLERDGYFYGRGTRDDKAMSAIWIANLIRYRQEGFTPSRDLIVALTADEEGGPDNGVRWLLANHRDLIEAEYTFNEGGGGQTRNGERLLNGVQASEKMFLTFRLEVRNPGGHSSRPSKDNAIYHLAAGLNRLAEFDFPLRLNDVTRTYFERMALIEDGQVAADMQALAGADGDAVDPGAVARLSTSPYYNALMRTTCVATRLEAGHADNALPQTARAVVNCRLLPDEDPEDVRATLAQVLDDDRIILTGGSPTPSPPSPLTSSLFETIDRITDDMWPGVPVVPTMSTGSTDGLSLRRAGIPVYGVSGLFGDVDDNRAHGQDERMGVAAFFDGLEFLYRLVRAVSS